MSSTSASMAAMGCGTWTISGSPAPPVPWATSRTLDTVRAHVMAKSQRMRVRSAELTCSLSIALLYAPMTSKPFRS